MFEFVVIYKSKEQNYHETKLVGFIFIGYCFYVNRKESITIPKGFV